MTDDLAIIHGDYTAAPVSAEALAEFEAEAKRTSAALGRKAAERFAGA